LAPSVKDKAANARVSSNLDRHPFDLSHVIMLDNVFVAVIPRDCDSAPCRSDNCALIGRAGFPANAVASFEKSGLVAGH
jgi:hypothetical protein